MSGAYALGMVAGSDDAKASAPVENTSFFAQKSGFQVAVINAKGIEVSRRELLCKIWEEVGTGNYPRLW